MTGDNTIVAGFPVYAMAFTKDRRLLLAGGGGAGRSGVKNKIVIYKLDEDEWKKLAEHAFSNEEDAPMSLAVHPEDPKIFVCGANRPESEVEKGENKNLRVFEIHDEKLSQFKSVKTMSSKSADDYQKSVAFSPDGKLIATGSSDGELTVLRYPSLEKAFTTSTFGGEEIYDLDFSPGGEHIAALSDSSVKILLADDGKVSQSIERPTLNKKIPCKFRCLRYGKGDNGVFLYTVVNAADRRRGFICKWDTKSWTLAGKAAVSKRAITALCVSSDCQLLGFGSQNLSVGIVDAITLRLLKAYSEVHGLPPTVVSFDADATNLVSASADTTFRVTELPSKYPSGGIFATLPSINILILVQVSLLVVGLALYIQQGSLDHASVMDVMRSATAKLEHIVNLTWSLAERHDEL